MKDIAERAGVSISTVSVVLSGSNRLAISEETRQAIQAIARELKYEPNSLARNLARGSSNLYGAVISEIANPFFPEIVRSFESMAASLGREMLLFNTEYDPERARVAVSKMIASNICGAAIFTSKFDRELVNDLVERSIPTVRVQQTPAEPGIGALKIDFADGLAQAVQHLLALGHRRFAAITGPDSIPSAKAYAATLIAVTKHLKVRLGQVVSCNYRHDGGLAAVQSLFAKPEFPSAILCANDLIALGAISELERAGLSVPEDVSVVGFDDLVFAHLSRPPLTTVAVGREEIGSLACEMLEKMARNQKAQNRVVTPRLVIRGSTAQAKPLARVRSGSR